MKRIFRHFKGFLHYEIRSFLRSDMPRIRGKFFIFLFNILPALYCLKHIRNLCLKSAGIKLELDNNYFKGKIYADAPQNLIFGSGYMNYNVSFEGGGKIVIGNNHKIGPNVMFVTSDHTKKSTIALDIVIGDNVWIGAGAIIIGGAIIGDNTIIGAGSVVPRGKYLSIDQKLIYVGNPARSITSSLI